MIIQIIFTFSYITLLNPKYKQLFHRLQTES